MGLSRNFIRGSWAVRGFSAPASRPQPVTDATGIRSCVSPMGCSPTSRHCKHQEILQWPASAVRAPSWPSSERPRLFLAAAFFRTRVTLHDLNAWLCGPCSIVPIDNNNRKSNGRSLGSLKPPARHPRAMTSLHVWLLHMMSPKKRPGAVSRPGAIYHFQFPYSMIHEKVNDNSQAARLRLAAPMRIWPSSVLYGNS
jgi:hypothetical protein